MSNLLETSNRKTNNKPSLVEIDNHHHQNSFETDICNFDIFES